MNQDKRVQKTLKEIDDSFFRLVKEKEIEKITIKDICKGANISRSTFYEHFEDYPSYIKALQHQLAKQLTDINSFYHYDTDTSTLLDHLVDFLYENKDNLFVFFYNNNCETIDQLNSDLKEHIIPIWKKESGLSDIEVEFIFTYFIQGSSAVIKFWYEHQREMTVEQFKDMYDNVVKYGIYQYIYTV